MSSKMRLFDTSSSIRLLTQYFLKKGIHITEGEIAEGYAPPPETVYIALNNACQCQCVMCANGQKKDMHSECISLGMLEGLVQELAPLGTFFAFYRQEPLLFNAFSSCLDIINSQQASCQITTNGLLLDSFSDKILCSNVKRLWVSIDGPELIHNSIRKYKDCYSIVINNLKSFLQKNSFVHRSLIA